MMNSQHDSIDRDTLRLEIQTAIAAGRDLEPSMDGHLADAVIDRYLAARPKTPQVIETRHESVTLDGVVLRAASLLLSAGIIVALIQGHIWWMFWLIIPIMAMLLGIFSTGGHRRRERYVSEYAASEQPKRYDRREYREMKRRYKMEKLAAKRAFLSGFNRGFHGQASEQ